MRKFLIVGIAMLFAATAFAAEVGGVKLDDKVAVGGQELVLNGAGIRTGSCSRSTWQPLPAGQGSRLAGVLAKAPRRIQMNMLRT